MNKQEQELLRKVLNGEELKLKDIAEILGVSPNTVKSRINRGWKLGDACLEKPIDRAEAGRRGKKNSPWSKQKRMIP